MTELQAKLLEMFKFFHEFCVKNNLVYYAIGGTALGAVRHNGFIPWDDDVDVGMPRLDYNKMTELLKKNNKFGKYIIEMPLEKNDSMYPFCKIYDTATTFVENVRNKPKRGIYIDIFPLDGIGNTKEESLTNYKRINFWIDLLNTKICAVRKGRGFLKNVAVAISGVIPECILGKKQLINKIDKMIKRNNYETSEYTVNYFGAWKEREITKKEWFGKPSICKFENMEIYIPENADKYLTALYGEYMQLPPPEKRVSHHDYIELDLNKSYSV